LKTESRRRREQRETDATTLVAETKRRREIVERQFYAWNDGKKVDCSLVHTALRTYADMHDASLLLTRPLDPVDKHHSTFYLADYMKVHTHTHPFNGPLSGTTWMSRYQKGKTSLDFTEAKDSEWQWHQLDRMQVCTSLQSGNTKAAVSA